MDCGTASETLALRGNRCRIGNGVLHIFSRCERSLRRLKAALQQTGNTSAEKVEDDDENEDQR